MEISLYLALCVVKSRWEFPCTLAYVSQKKNWHRLPELLINLPIVFKIGKINKLCFVSCQEKVASYMVLTKNEHLGLLFTIFVAFLEKRPYLS